tara:strand:- start:400 stop:624 length:225 start_codon:yes stop_codon:yes gene_type:complete
MGVQKNIGLLKAKNEEVIENLKAVIRDEYQTREIAIGTLELLKLMPGYDAALEILKKKSEEKKDVPFTPVLKKI